MNPDIQAILGQRAPDFRAKIGMVLGSGMGGFADTLADAISIPYADLPGFGRSGVSGHAGRLVLGRIGATSIAALQGRVHYYERGDAGAMQVPIATLAGLGCEMLVATNAAGSLKSDMGPGSLMLIADHLNLTQVSPLFDVEGDNRFVDMVDAYDPALRMAMKEKAAALEIKLHEGVYAWVSGPHFETPAEIRMLQTMGADAVGMSTVPDVILARYHGMKVMGVSAITNLGAGMSDGNLSHEHTMSQMLAASGQLSRLLRAWIEGLA
ncbi:purine-nucleoside phosphorylase [Dongia sp.]|uniref:purine-nucleoside phosphorylase n=1 Tax=Dongia sp. TaxID=1977262 RepID=UPI0035B0BDDE